MELKDISANKKYRVTKGSDCTTLRAGDTVILDKSNYLLCPQAGGFLPPEEWQQLKGVEVKPIHKAVEYLTPKEAAAILSVTPALIRVWIKTGRLKSAVKIYGTRWYIHKSEILGLLQEAYK